MKNSFIKKLAGILVFVICLPVVCTIFIQPDREEHYQAENDTSVINERFRVLVHEEAGDFLYKPEEFTALLMYSVIPADIVFSDSEDYIDTSGLAQDPEQEYLKALAVVCRTNIIYVWETQGYPEVFDFDKMELDFSDFAKLYADSAADDHSKTKMNEIKRAADTTIGAVITKENEVTAAPFFTTSDTGMLVGEAGDGVGFSRNFAYALAIQGMDFYEILKYFFGDIKIVMYE